MEGKWKFKNAGKIKQAVAAIAIKSTEAKAIAIGQRELANLSKAKVKKAVCNTRCFTCLACLL